MHYGRITRHRYLEPEAAIVLQAEELVDRDKTWCNATPLRVAQTQRQTVNGRDEYAQIVSQLRRIPEESANWQNIHSPNGHRGLATKAFNPQNGFREPLLEQAVSGIALSHQRRPRGTYTRVAHSGGA
jgi:hypothetical protein